MSDTQVSERRLRRRQLESSDAPPSSDDSSAAGMTADTPPPVLSSLAGGGWKSLDEHAFSGIPVQVRSVHGDIAEACHIKSRRFNRQTLKWEPVNIWRVRNASGTTLPFDPVEYRDLS